MSRFLFFAAILWSGWCTAQRAPVIKLKDLQQIMAGTGGEIQVINFWATWCGPCVKELPLFEALNQKRPDVRVTLVSMDLDLDPDPEKVHRFIARKKIQSSVVLLDEQDPNAWIDRIESQWSGSLPATLLINPRTGKRKFVGQELHEGELERLLKEIE